MHVRPQPTTPTGVPAGSSVRRRRLSMFASAKSAIVSIPKGSTRACTSWTWKQVLQKHFLDLDGELLLELGGELVELRPRALDEEDGHFLLWSDPGSRQQRVPELLDRDALRRCQIHHPLQDLLAPRSLRVHRRFDDVDAAPAPALHETLTLEVGDHTRHRVAVHPQEPSQGSDARQSIPRFESPGQDEMLDLLLQLYVYRHVAFLIYL